MRTGVAIVAGHVCIDFIPEMSGPTPGPGRLAEVGPPSLSTGGAVANTGLALHRLGVGVTLKGKVGDDFFGARVREVFASVDPSLAEGVIVDPAAATSYTVVINPPNVDRAFLHCPGANDSYAAEDVADEDMLGKKLLHFGYPPLMRRFFESGGGEIAALFGRARRLGLTTSLDMARPDPASDAGRVDWERFLARALPHTDIFCPSFDELLFMLDRPFFERLQAGGWSDPPELEKLFGVAERCLQMGAGVVAIKLGEHGLYLRSAGGERLRSMGAGLGDAARAWERRELWSPCLKAGVKGTTGAGDATIAGLLAGVLEGSPPEEVARLAVATGAASVEGLDATGAIPSRTALAERLARGWPVRGGARPPMGWPEWDGGQISAGPFDGR